MDIFMSHAIALPMAILVGMLLLATLVVEGLVLTGRLGADAEVRLRTRSWWVMLGLFGSALYVGPVASWWLLGFTSYLALKEFFTVIPTRRSDRRVLLWAYLAIPFQYYWAAIGWYGMFIIFIPVYLFLFIPMRKVLIGETEAFLRSVGSIQWGLMMTVFGLSHAAFLLALPEGVAPAGGAGLLLFLVALTELNDVAQYLFGKGFGRRKVLPGVSPGKSWAGLLGGVVSTVLMAWLAAPLLTPLSPYQALAAGLLIGVFGFVGDVTLSAVKRDLGIKDSGRLLPGHGGILDRVDSLTYTAPLFFHFLYFLHY